MKEKKKKRYIKLCLQIQKCLKRLKVKQYKSRYSKRVYNNWTHIILLALRQRMDKSYREFCDVLDVCTEILSLLGIKQAPHFTTLQKAAKRLKIQVLEKIVSGFVLITMSLSIRTSVDATGFQLTRASSYYTNIVKKDKKKRRRIKRHMKLSAFVDLDHMLIISQKIRRGPAHDSPDFKIVIRKGKKILDEAGKEVKSVDADKGYDSEENHEIVVEELHAEDRIRLKNKDVPIWRTKGYHRKKAKKRINRLRSNYRSKHETTFSVLKRVFGSKIGSIKVSMQNKEMVLKEIAYNASRLINHFIEFLKEFYRA